jgi:hypothetical protein
MSACRRGLPGCERPVAGCIEHPGPPEALQTACQASMALRTASPACLKGLLIDQGRPRSLTCDAVNREALGGLERPHRFLGEVPEVAIDLDVLVVPVE